VWRAERNRRVWKLVVGLMLEPSIFGEVMNGSCHVECGDATASATFSFMHVWRNRSNVS
jgi:hypothetical protein